MKRLPVHLFLLIVLQSMVFILPAQDPGFSQFYGNPVYLNPALAGNKFCPRITLNYRNQWPSVPASFITYSVSYDQFADFLNGGVALLVVSDRAGDGMMTNNSFSGVYSYRLQISRHIVLNAGLQATFQQISINWDKFIFADQLSSGTVTQETPPGSLSRSFPDFSTGFIVGYRESIYLGVAAHHLTQPDNGFYSGTGSKQPMKITAHAGAIFNLVPSSPFEDQQQIPSVSPNILYQQQGDFRQLNFGAYLNIYPFVAGGWFRHNFENPDAIIALLGFEYKQYKVGYTYDYTISKLTNTTGGSHEISLAWTFACLEGSGKREKIKAIKCPTF